MGPQSPVPRSPPTRVTAAAVVATVVFSQLVLLALAAVVFGVVTWARTDPEGRLIRVAVFIAAALIGCLGVVCVSICVAAFRGRPGQLFELQILTGTGAFIGGLTAAVIFGLGVWNLARVPWQFLREDIAEPQSALLLLVWLDAVALLVAGLLLRNQSQPYADWWRQRHASESSDPTR
jgi:hypothetical protein